MCEWLTKVWYVHAMEYYPAVKRNTSDACNNLDGPWIFILNERS